MKYAIVDTLLGLLLAGAAIGIPRVIAIRKNHPEDQTDTQAYMKETGRSAQDIAESNQALQHENDAGSRQAGDSGAPPPSNGAGSREANKR
jgi:hypothetical protein